MRRFLIVLTVVLIASGCASTTSRAVRSEFEDIPIPRGLTLDLDDSTIIESPSVKAARLSYKGRLQADSLGTAFRTTLESNGWKHVSSATAASQGTTQVYEKPGHSLHVQIYECWLSFYTCVQLSATRVVGTAQQPMAVQPAAAESTVGQATIGQPATIPR